MGREETFDLDSWILSPEIRELIRKKLPLPLIEQGKIVYHAYRSVEDKLQAITCLLGRAEEEEERECLAQTADYLRFAVRHMADGKSCGQSREGQEGVKEIWMASCGDYDFAARNHDFTDVYLFYSYGEAKKWAKEYLDDPGTRCFLRKWMLEKEGPKELMECALRQVGDQFSVTCAYLEKKNCGLELPWQIDGDRFPYGLFRTGDLVKLDGPAFFQPVFGVWGEAFWDRQYNWMGRLKTDEERKWCAENGYGDSPYISDRMSDYRLQELWEFSILDWLHSATEEELPDGQKELGEIGRELRKLRERSNEEAVERFHEIFP